MLLGDCKALLGGMCFIVLLVGTTCWAVEGNKFSQNLIVSSYELVSPPYHLIPTFAYCECHFNLHFSTSLPPA